MQVRVSVKNLKKKGGEINREGEKRERRQNCNTTSCEILKNKTKVDTIKMGKQYKKNK